MDEYDQSMGYLEFKNTEMKGNLHYSMRTSGFYQWSQLDMVALN